MRVLYLTNKPVYPIVDGGCRAMQRMLECLVLNEYEIEHICISTEKHPFDSSQYPGHIKVIGDVFISTKIRPLKALYNLLIGKSYHISRFKSKDMDRKLEDVLKSKDFDLVFMESLYLTPYTDHIRKFSKAKIVVRTHNVEYTIWEKLSDSSKRFFKKWYLNKLSGQLKKYELDALQKVDFLVVISSDDKLILDENGVKTPKAVIPVSFPDIPSKVDYSSSVFFHLGSMNWSPNIEAVDLLLERIFPEIQKKNENAHLKIAGSYMPERLKNHRQNGVEILGFVDDAFNFFRNEGIFLAPIKSGSGVRIKILEAMLIGVPVITTQQGAEGIEKSDSLLVAKNNEEFVIMALDLSQNETKRKDLGTKACAFIRANYSTNSVAKKLNEVLRSI